MRRFIPTHVHAIADYAVGATLLALPRLLQHDRSLASRATRAWGAVGVLSGLTTKHELGLVPVLPMRAHLAADTLGGAALAALPFVAGEARGDKRNWLPAVAAGAAGVFFGLATKTESGREGAHGRRTGTG